jgi:hypothetical protein
MTVPKEAFEASVLYFLAQKYYANSVYVFLALFALEPLELNSKCINITQKKRKQ